MKLLLYFLHYTNQQQLIFQGRILRLNQIVIIFASFIIQDDNDSEQSKKINPRAQ